ncbi:hypothetical protein [Clostridium butyricum]
MKINIGEYQITTDTLQFVVNKKTTIKESRFTKAENIGKEVFKPIAYCTTFESALKFIPQDVSRCNDEILVISEKLEQIKGIIKEIPQPIKIEVEKIVYRDKKNEGEEID